VTEVVRGHLALEALRRQHERPAHDAGVADQGGELVVSVEQRRGAIRELVEVGQVELDDARRAGPFEAPGCLLALCRIAHRQHDLGAASDERPGRLEADAAVGAGHDEGASRLLGQLPGMPAHARSVRAGRTPQDGVPPASRQIRDRRFAPEERKPTVDAAAEAGGPVAPQASGTT
jgi:hypothetical protein